jgi:integrase
MPKLHLTERAIDKLPAPDPSGKQVLHWDRDLKGFAVLCSGITRTKTYVVQRTLPGGKNRRVTVGAVNELSLEKATSLAADLLHRLRKGDDPKKKIDNPTLKSTLAAYLLARKNLSPASVHVYRQVERTLVGWLDKPLRDITGDMIEDRHCAIAKNMGKQGHHKGYVTANGAMRTFRNLYNFALDRTPDLPANPVRRLKKGDWFSEEPKKPSSERRIPETKMAEFYAALRALPHPVQRDYITLMLFTGMRRTETARLKWTDIDLANRIINMPAAYTKPKRAFSLPMSDVVHQLLVVRKQGSDPAGYVFPGKSAGHHIVGVTAPLQAIAKVTGVSVSAHDLRRTFTDVVQAAVGGNWLVMKKLINHSIKGDVTALYPEMMLEQMRQPVQLVADLMKQRCGIAEPTGNNVRKLMA